MPPPACWPWGSRALVQQGWGAGAGEFHPHLNHTDQTQYPGARERRETQTLNGLCLAVPPAHGHTQKRFQQADHTLTIIGLSSAPQTAGKASQIPLCYCTEKECQGASGESLSLVERHFFQSRASRTLHGTSKQRNHHLYVLYIRTRKHIAHQSRAPTF